MVVKLLTKEPSLWLMHLHEFRGIPCLNNIPQTKLLQVPLDLKGYTSFPEHCTLRTKKALREPSNKREQKHYRFMRTQQKTALRRVLREIVVVVAAAVILLVVAAVVVVAGVGVGQEVAAILRIVAAAARKHPKSNTKTCITL